MFIFAQVLDIWAVLLSLGAGQLYLQFHRRGRRRFHEGMPKLLQLATGIPALVILALFMLDPDLPHRGLTRAERLVDLSGLVLFNAAGLLILSAHITLGDCWSGELETKEDHRLVNEGLYRWVRHPLYSSYLLLTIGLFLMSDNWLVGASMLVYFLSVASRAAREEAMMVERLGAHYVAYQNRTGRFLPRLAFRTIADRNGMEAEPGFTSSPQ